MTGCLLLARNASGDWWQVDYGGQEGWIAASLVEANRETTQVVPASKIPPTPAPASGRYIAFASDRDQNREIYVMNVDGTEQRRLTSNQASDGYPTWSPDG